MKNLVVLFMFSVVNLFSQVNFIAGSYSSSDNAGDGAGGLPTLNYTPSAGNDRLLLFTLIYERDHSAAKGTNWANPKSVGGSDPIVTFGAVGMSRLRTSTYYQYKGTAGKSNAVMSMEMIVYGILEASIPAGAGTFVISGINNPGHSGDEAFVSAMMFENVMGVNYLGSGGCQDCNSVGLTALDPLSMDNMIVTIAGVGSDRDVSAGAGNTMIGAGKTTNGNGTFKSFSEQDGIGVAAQFVTGTAAVQNPSFSMSGAADIFGVVEVGFRLIAASPLPIELNSFSVATLDKDNTLNWETGAEVNNESFKVERSTDGFKWIQIASIGGQKFSVITTSYMFVDENASCTNCYYRLKQVDYDGAYEFSNTVMVALESSARVKMYPNPALDEVILELPSELSTVLIYDASGKLLDRIEVVQRNRITIDVSSYTRGHYYVTVQSEHGSETSRLVKI